jgi:hypothetical protein
MGRWKGFFVLNCVPYSNPEECTLYSVPTGRPFFIVAKHLKLVLLHNGGFAMAASQNGFSTCKFPFVRKPILSRNILDFFITSH